MLYLFLNYIQLCDDIKSYRDSIIFIGDNNIMNCTPQFLSPTTSGLDFNDSYYIILCKEFSKTTDLTLVTAHADFAVEDVEILTSNPRLLQLKT